MPTCSGVAVARGWSSRAQTGSDTVVAITIAASAVVANIFHLGMTFLHDRPCEDRVSLDPATILSDIVTLAHTSGYRILVRLRLADRRVRQPGRQGHHRPDQGGSRGDPE